VTITAGNSPPTAVIDTSTPARTWTVGDTIGFSGHASDPHRHRQRAARPPDGGPRLPVEPGRAAAHGG
jgi:hypothetical protein